MELLFTGDEELGGHELHDDAEAAEKDLSGHNRHGEGPTKGLYVPELQA